MAMIFNSAHSLLMLMVLIVSADVSPRDYIVQVTDTGGVLTGGSYTTTGNNTQTVSLDQVGTSNTGVDFGYQLPIVPPAGFR